MDLSCGWRRIGAKRLHEVRDVMVGADVRSLNMAENGDDLGRQVG